MLLPGGLTLGMIGLGVVLAIGLLMLLEAVRLDDKNWIQLVSTRFRRIEAFERLQESLKQSVEKGQRAHVSLGSGNLWGFPAASAFLGLSVLSRIMQTTTISDKHTRTTSGTGIIHILSQDSTLKSFAQSGLEGRYQYDSTQLTGATPYSYASGTLALMLDQEVAVNVFLGHFREEVAIMIDTAEAYGAKTLAGSDDLSAQSIIYITTDLGLIGEELFAAGAYTLAGRMHVASLRIQDLLRWIIVVLILAGAAVRLINGL